MCKQTGYWLLHEIRSVTHPSTLDQGIQLKGRSTILQPATTIGNILENVGSILEKDIMLDFRLRAIPRLS